MILKEQYWNQYPAIAIFQKYMLPEMRISKINTTNSRRSMDIYIAYKDMEGWCEVQKNIPSGREEKICRDAINVAVSMMYFKAGDIQEAQKWLAGERM